MQYRWNSCWDAFYTSGILILLFFSLFCKKKCALIFIQILMRTNNNNNIIVNDFCTLLFSSRINFNQVEINYMIISLSTNTRPSQTSTY